MRAESDALGVEYRDAETQLRAAIVAGDDGTPAPAGDSPETRELRDLAGRASVGAIFAAAVEHRNTDGATRELQEHYGLGSNSVPLAMLAEAGLRAAAGVEFRAVTPAPGQVAQNQSEIVPYVFPAACATFLSIDMPTVGVGDSVYPILSKELDVRTPAENADADETTGTFSASVLSPSRIQASFFFSREDRARFAGMDSALRMNLSDGLSDGLDRQILVGTNGLFSGTNLSNHAAAAVTTFAGYKSDLGYGRVDGRYAAGVGDLRMVMGSGTYAHAATIYRANNADDSALDVLMSRTAGVKVSAHVPAPTGSNKKQNAVVRLGMARDAVAPVWEGVTIIPDEVTKAKQGQIQITAVMLHAVKVLRADGFYKQETQHA